MSDTLSIGAKVARVLSILMGLPLLIIGVGWLVAPAVAAGSLGASLLQGTGLTTQIADSGAFFLCTGGFIVYGAIARNPSLLFAGALLVGLVAPIRILAWQVHGAAFTLDFIVIEVLTCIVALLTARAMRRAG